MIGANGAVGLCLVQVATALGATPVAVVRRPGAVERLVSLGAEVVVAEADEAPERVRDRVGAVDVLVDSTGRIDLPRCADLLAPRGRIVLVAGRDPFTVERWPFYTRELQLLGFVMSRMTVAELAAAAEWINRHHPFVGVGPRLGFAEAAAAHRMIEGGQLPRLDDGTVGRIVLTP